MAKGADQRGAEVAFTYRWYREFLDRLRSAGYELGTVADGIDDGRVVLRHDVDLSLDAAVTMAHIEADYGVQSTYCVLLTSPLYNALEGDKRRAIREIESLGHEVALHFSTHEHWDADEEPPRAEIERRVAEELTVLDAITDRPTDTVSFHIPPSWVLDRTFEGFHNTYEPALFGDVGYVADSVQRWRDDEPDVDSLPDRAQVLTHPGLWGPSDGDFEDRVESAVTDAYCHTRSKAIEEFVEGVDES
jgi:peptidoglycan/xylan/chitin deacetylase (PgdA/CDA1 family)